MPNVGGGRGVITQQRAGLASHVGLRHPDRVRHTMDEAIYRKPKGYSTERATTAARGAMQGRGMKVPTHQAVRSTLKKWTTKRRGGRRRKAG